MYEGRLFRPPSEASSLILQVTVGCAHNQCTFCSMYKEKEFRIKPLEEILDLIDQLSKRYGAAERIFIADGDALILPMTYWRPLLKALSARFNRLSRVTAYGTPRDVLAKTDEELAELKDLGLSMIYMGLETGSDELLEAICKGVASQQMIQAGQKLKRAGIKQSITVLLGIGGRTHSESHARETARVLSAMDPEYTGLLTLMLEEGTPMLADVLSGKMAILSPKEVLQETRWLIEGLTLSDCHFRSNHASNYLALSGHFPEAKDQLLEQIDRALGGESRLRGEEARRL